MAMSTFRFFSCRVLAIFSAVPPNGEPVHRVPILGGVALFLGAFLQVECQAMVSLWSVVLTWIFFLHPFLAPGRTGCKSNSDCKVWAECTDGTCHCRAELQGDGNTCNKGGKVHAMVLWVLSLTIAFLWDYIAALHSRPYTRFACISCSDSNVSRTHAQVRWTDTYVHELYLTPSIYQ